MNWTSPHKTPLPQLKDRPLIMGILNVSTDSFSDGGKYFKLDDAIKHTQQMIAQGADIIDIGAESTRPNAILLPVDEEIERLIPQLNALRKNFPEIPISVDTYKPEVAKIAIAHGADIINDVCVNLENGIYKMAEVAATTCAPIIITHNQRGESFEGDFFEFFMDSMGKRIQKTLECGVEKHQIILDVGFGFGKTHSQNFELVKRLGEVKKLGYPILLGVSRKSSLASVVGEDFEVRDDATAAISAIAVANKSVDILRVHNISKNLTAVKIAQNLI